MISPMMAPSGVVVLTVPNNISIQPPGPKPELQKRFARGEPKALGVVQILIGLIQICLGAFLLNNPISSVYPYSGLPFWGSALYIISGALSVAAEKKGTSGLVRGSMAMNIVSCIITLPALIITSFDIFLIYINLSESSACDYSPPGNDGQSCFTYRDGLLAQHQGILALALILIGLESCITLSTSIFGCKALCQCCGAPDGTQPMFVVHNTYGQNPSFASVASTEASAASPPSYYDNFPVNAKPQ